MIKRFCFIFILLIVILFVSFTEPVNAQFEFGFRAEQEILFFRSYPNSPGSAASVLPSCIQLTLGYYPAKNILAEVRIGNEFGLPDLTDYYSGFECGIYGKYFLSKPFYLTAGLAYHSNDGTLISNQSARRSGSLLMPALGIGVKPWNHVGFEGLYQLAGGQAVSATNGMQKTFLSILKIGMVCTW